MLNLNTPTFPFSCFFFLCTDNELYLYILEYFFLEEISLEQLRKKIEKMQAEVFPINKKTLKQLSDDKSEVIRLTSQNKIEEYTDSVKKIPENEMSSFIASQVNDFFKEKRLVQW